MSSNEPLKKEAVAKLEGGGLFAFAVSEKEHGSDLLANEFMVKPTGSGGLLAEGTKYYIGNANIACIISVLARQDDVESGRTNKRLPFVLFALRPSEAPAFRNLRKIRTLGVRAAFVGQFEVKGHPFTAADVISRGREAWEAVFGTVDFGKFFLGFGSVGICEHAFVEAAAYLRRRVLYGKPVAEMPHIRAMTSIAFARLTAMKLYAYRALDYLHAAGKDDRRYLLFNAVQKAKVSTEGVKVLGLLSECMGARGVESETYFESAVRDAQLIPGLEGSTHINFALTARFIDAYFAPSGDKATPGPVVAHRAGADENAYWMQSGDRNAKTVRFAHYLRAYQHLRSLPNVVLFLEQVEAFRSFVPEGLSGSAADGELPIEMGKCFSTIVYAQLVAENCESAAMAPALVSVIFHALVEDLGAQSLKLSAMFPTGSSQRALLKAAVRVPETAPADWRFVADLIAAR